MKKLIIAVIAAAVLPIATYAWHSWGGYHWARQTPSFTLTIVNSTTSSWDHYVQNAVGDWSNSRVIDLVQENGKTSNRVRSRCNAPSGKVRICNANYGQNGWLGIAGISIDSNGHITKGYTKLNDSYFSLSYYNTPDWMQSVACQELGHNIGLDHQDEDFNNGSLFSCMDYQDPPHPWTNAHDFEQLVAIYGDHTDLYDSYAGAPAPDGESGGGGGCNAPPGKGCNKAGRNPNASPNGWGVSEGRRGNSERFRRDNPDGTTEFTFVTWVDGHDDGHDEGH